MGMWADWKEIRKKSKAEGLRARISKYTVEILTIRAKQLQLTNQAELLEGTCAICEDDGPHLGEPILSGSKR